MKSTFYHDRLKLSSKLKRTPKANKKINLNNFIKGYDNIAESKLSGKRFDKCAKLENKNQDYIAGIDSAALHLLDIKG